MFNLPKHIVVLDLEITTWEGALHRNWSGENEYKEVIQIGAAQVETDTFEILDTFDEFVKPKMNPTLSEYCMELTHISQEDIDNAKSFPEVLNQFSAWCEDLELYCYGKIKESPRLLDRDALMENAELLGISLPFAYDRFHNINQIFFDHGYDVQQSGSAPKAFGLELPARPHNALNDVTGLVTGLRALRDVVLREA